jgi:hypothetical protein
MLRHITPPTVKELIRLRREAHESMLRRNAGRPIWEDFSTFNRHQSSPEEDTFQEFLFGLSQDELIELLALYFLGTRQTSKPRVEQTLQGVLNESRRNSDHIPEYLHSKNILLAEALERSLELLGW